MTRTARIAGMRGRLRDGVERRDRKAKLPSREYAAAALLPSLEIAGAAGSLTPSSMARPWRAPGGAAVRRHPSARGRTRRPVEVQPVGRVGGLVPVRIAEL